MNAVSLKTVTFLRDWILSLVTITAGFVCAVTASTRHALYQQHAERLKKEFKTYVNSLCLNRNWTLQTQHFQHWLTEFVLPTSPPLHHHTHPVPFWISLISVNITTIHLLSAKSLVNTHPKYFSRTAYSLSSPLFFTVTQAAVPPRLDYCSNLLTCLPTLRVSANSARKPVWPASPCLKPSRGFPLRLG